MIVTAILYDICILVRSLLTQDHQFYFCWTLYRGDAKGNKNYFKLAAGSSYRGFELSPNSLYRAARFANFEGILGFSVPSVILADLLGNACLLVIGAFRSTLFVSMFQGSLLVITLLLRTVNFRQWSTSFVRSFLWSFLYLSLARRKQCVPLALNKNSTHHRDFLRFSWAVKGHSQFCFCGPSWANAWHCDLC